MELENERAWLRHRVLRMRTALRFAMSPEVTDILRELITDAEARLSALDAQAKERGQSGNVFMLFPTLRSRFPNPKK
jgi:hypothetical protein